MRSRGSMNLTSQQRETIRQWGEKAQYVRAIRLFGSRARGEATEKSDIDLAVTIGGDDPGTVLGIYFARSKVADGIDEPLRHQGSCRPIRRSRYGYHPEVVRRVQHSAFSVTACDSCAASLPHGPLRLRRRLQGHRRERPKPRLRLRPSPRGSECHSQSLPPRGRAVRPRRGSG